LSCRDCLYGKEEEGKRERTCNLEETGMKVGERDRERLLGGVTTRRFE